MKIADDPDICWTWLDGLGQITRYARGRQSHVVPCVVAFDMTRVE